MAKSREAALGCEARKVVLIILFVPSADRNGDALGQGIQDQWVHLAMERLGGLFSGATAMPPARGCWRDDENGGQLIFETPVLVHCYATEEDSMNLQKMADLGRFCRTMRDKLRQGEIGLIIDNVYHPIR